MIEIDTMKEEKEDMAEDLTFEEAMKQLEEIAKLLEDGDLPLEESLKVFEEGVRLSKICNLKLDVIEKRLEVLVRGKDGELEEREMTLDEE
ncbi:MAG: exodeoxyribonuclease VII small subunit [Candidatus Syntropharchaeales archaeon]